MTARENDPAARVQIDFAPVTEVECGASSYVQRHWNRCTTENASDVNASDVNASDHKRADRRRLLRPYVLPMRAASQVGRHWGAERKTIFIGLSTQTVAAVAGLCAGLMLANISGTLEKFPSFLVLLVPVVGVRGSVFGAMGARLGTAVQVGEFEFGWCKNGVLRRNIAAVFVLSTTASAALAVGGWALSNALGRKTDTLFDFAVISIVGGLLASCVIGTVAVGVAWMSVRWDFDPDQVASPLITLAGDLSGVPSLALAALLAGHGNFTTVFGSILLFGGAVFLFVALFRLSRTAKRIVLESLPILGLVGGIDLLAGVVVAGNKDVLSYAVFLMLLPAFLATSGGLGGVFASRLTTKLHLGSVEPRLWPQQVVFLDMTVVYLFGFVIFPVLAMVAEMVTYSQGLAGPGVFVTVRGILAAGVLTCTLALFVGYYMAFISLRFGLDPDNYSIPVVTSTMDLLGVLCFTAVLTMIGV